MDLGISSVSAAGDVYNLKSVSDFAGTYSGGGAGYAAAGGLGVATLTNQKSAKIKIKSKQKGVQLKLAPVEMKVELVE